MIKQLIELIRYSLRPRVRVRRKRRLERPVIEVHSRTRGRRRR